MEFSTELYLAVIAHHKALLGEPDDVGYSFSYRIDGGGRASDDSAVMMSGKMYADFVKPYNARAYQTTQGGMLHFCGKGDQFYDHMLDTAGVTGINFGNPEMQDFAPATTRPSRTRSACSGTATCRRNLTTSRPASSTSVSRAAGARRRRGPRRSMPG